AQPVKRPALPTYSPLPVFFWLRASLATLHLEHPTPSRRKVKLTCVHGDLTGISRPLGDPSTESWRGPANTSRPASSDRGGRRARQEEEPCWQPSNCLRASAPAASLVCNSRRGSSVGLGRRWRSISPTAARPSTTPCTCAAIAAGSPGGANRRI